MGADTRRIGVCFPSDIGRVTLEQRSPGPANPEQGYMYMSPTAKLSRIFANVCLESDSFLYLPSAVTFFVFNIFCSDFFPVEAWL